MARRWADSGALVLSAVAHAVLLSCGALILSHGLRATAHSRVKARAERPAEVEVELPTFDASSVDTNGEAPDIQPVESAALPSAYGGPAERHPDTEHGGRGGSRTTPFPATNLDSHIDPLALETDLLTHLDRSQVQRLHTSNERRSWDDHRSTPNPMQLTFLATGKGFVQERMPRDDAARGSRSGDVRALLGGAPGQAARAAGDAANASAGAVAPGRERAVEARGTPAVTSGSAPRNGAAVLLARPLVMRARPALPTEVRARPNDTDDSTQAVAARVAALIHASTIGAPVGPGVGGDATSGAPGRSGAEGMGSHSPASGFGPGSDAASDPGVQGFIAGLKQRVDGQLRRAFPDWAIEEGRSGHVIFELALTADGRLERVRMLRPSGIEEYDGNVLSGVRRIASFGPLPKALGQRALITMSYDSLNHVIGRSGPGPGGYGSISQTQ